MREETYSFEKLEAWKKAKDLALFIYEITSHFPDTERYGLVSQMRKCAIGIPSHLAEGSGRITGKDTLQVITILSEHTLRNFPFSSPDLENHN